EHPQTAADAARRARTVESLRRFFMELRESEETEARLIEQSRRAIRESRQAIENAPDT
ncbi:MAG: hypothetical protein JO127_09990, partial [Caulobacteraceae bacterium]|nr:hypothetical protein [Caulobacteraceae bacterium]